MATMCSRRDAHAARRTRARAPAARRRRPRPRAGRATLPRVGERPGPRPAPGTGALHRACPRRSARPPPPRRRPAARYQRAGWSAPSCSVRQPTRPRAPKRGREVLALDRLAREAVLRAARRRGRARARPPPRTPPAAAGPPAGARRPRRAPPPARTPPRCASSVRAYIARARSAPKRSRASLWKAPCRRSGSRRCARSRRRRRSPRLEQDRLDPVLRQPARARQPAHAAADHARLHLDVARRAAAAARRARRARTASCLRSRGRPGAPSARRRRPSAIAPRRSQLARELGGPRRAAPPASDGSDTFTATGPSPVHPGERHGDRVEPDLVLLARVRDAVAPHALEVRTELAPSS